MGATFAEFVFLCFRKKFTYFLDERQIPFGRDGKAVLLRIVNRDLALGLLRLILLLLYNMIYN